MLEKEEFINTLLSVFVFCLAILIIGAFIAILNALGLIALPWQRAIEREANQNSQAYIESINTVIAEDISAWSKAEVDKIESPEKFDAFTAYQNSLVDEVCQKASKVDFELLTEPNQVFVRAHCSGQ